MIHDPERVLFAFMQDEEEGMGIAEGKAEHICFAPESYDVIEKLVSAGYHFYDGSGNPIQLVDKAIPWSFWGPGVNVNDFGILGAVQHNGLIYITRYTADKKFKCFAHGDKEINPKPGSENEAVKVKLHKGSKKEDGTYNGTYEVINSQGTTIDNGNVVLQACVEKDEENTLDNSFTCESFNDLEFRALLTKELALDDPRRENIDEFVDYIKEKIVNKKWGTLVSMPENSTDYNQFNGERLLLKSLRDYEIFTIADFEKEFSFFDCNGENNGEPSPVIRNIDLLITNVDFSNLPAYYNLYSYDFESFDLPVIHTMEDFDFYVDLIEDYLTYSEDIFSTEEYAQILKVVADYRENGETYVSSHKLELRMHMMGVFMALGAYSNYEYDVADLKKREELKRIESDWYSQIIQKESKGLAIPITQHNAYDQYVAKYQTNSAFYLGISYMKMMAEVIELNIVGDAVSAMAKVATKQRRFSTLFQKQFDITNKTLNFSRVTSKAKGFNLQAQNASQHIKTEIRSVRGWAKSKGYAKKPGTGSNTNTKEVWGYQKDGQFVECVEINHADNFKVSISHSGDDLAKSSDVSQVDISTNTFDDGLKTLAASRKTAIPSSLSNKLGKQTIQLDNWLANRALQLPSNSDELLSQMDELVGNREVLEVLEDGQGRLSVVLNSDGAAYDLLAIQKNVDGQYMVAKYNRAYKQSQNLDIDVGVSQNRLVPDYSVDMAGAPSTQYLYPQDLLPAGKSPVVKIKMTGKRTGLNGDFHEANKAAGISGTKAPGEGEYVWHHLDDFNPETGECTMQLVKSTAHTNISSMAHSGSVAQWKAYYINKSKAPNSLFYEQ